MDLKELVDLVAIRQYVINMSSSATIDRPTLNYMGHLLLMLDKKIISLLSDERFKEYVSFKDFKKTLEDVVQIKSGIKR